LFQFIHFDLHPGNVMLKEIPGTFVSVRIIDFGRSELVYGKNLFPGIGDTNNMGPHEKATTDLNFFINGIPALNGASINPELGLYKYNKEGTQGLNVCRTVPPPNLENNNNLGGGSRYKSRKSLQKNKRTKRVPKSRKSKRHQ
jgi:hypothetical protein